MLLSLYYKVPESLLDITAMNSLMFVDLAFVTAG